MKTRWRICAPEMVLSLRKGPCACAGVTGGSCGVYSCQKTENRRHNQGVACRCVMYLVLQWFLFFFSASLFATYPRVTFVQVLAPSFPQIPCLSLCDYFFSSITSSPHLLNSSHSFSSLSTNIRLPHNPASKINSIPLLTLPTHSHAHTHTHTHTHVHSLFLQLTHTLQLSSSFLSYPRAFFLSHKQIIFFLDLLILSDQLEIPSLTLGPPHSTFTQ